MRYKCFQHQAVTSNSVLVKSNRSSGQFLHLLQKLIWGAFLFFSSSLKTALSYYFTSHHPTKCSRNTWLISGNFSIQSLQAHSLPALPNIGALITERFSLPSPLATQALALHLFSQKALRQGDKENRNTLVVSISTHSFAERN